MSEQEEQQTKKKKAGIIKRILKSLGLGFLLLLLIVSIIFQASWKIITLLAIIFLACTALPKSCRKYFWLSVGGVVIALIVWVFLPEETEGWRPYTFDEELAELQAKYAIPDEENAAIVYNQLLEDYNEASFEPNFADPNLEYFIRTEFWSDEDYPEAVQWIGQHKNTIAKLIEATKIEQCQFPISPNIMNYDILDRVPPMRKWARVLVSAANNDAEEGRTNQAIEKYIATLQMGKHLRQQPAIINMLAGIGIETFSIKPLNRLVVSGDITEEHLSVIEKALIEMELDWSCDWPRTLDYEKLCVKSFAGMFYEINKEGKTRFTRYPIASIMQLLLEEESDASQLLESRMYTTCWKKKLMKAKTIWAWFYGPSTPQQAGEIIDAVYERYYAMAEPDYDWRKKPAEELPQIRLNFRFMVEFMVHILEGSFYSIHYSYLQTIAQNRVSRIMIALRRYKNEIGNWPGSLDEIKPLAAEEILTDPINGSSFVYELTDDNFTLYSKGKNSIDDGGKQDERNEEKTGADDLLIWPSRKGECR